MPRSYKAEVIADNSGVWAGNGLRFPTSTEADEYVIDLARRWMLVRDVRVVESDDEPNYNFVNGEGVKIQ
jgi:hypothetical protein